MAPSCNGLLTISKTENNASSYQVLIWLVFYKGWCATSVNSWTFVVLSIYKRYCRRNKLIYLFADDTNGVSKTSPCTSIQCWYFFILWSFRNVGFWQKAEYRLSRCQGVWELLHFPLVLANGLNTTESTVFLICRFSLFLKDPFFQIIIYIVIDDTLDSAIKLNTDLSRIDMWASKWLVTFNPSKSESLIFSRKLNKPYHPPIYINYQLVNEVTSHLGIYLSRDCTWHNHIEHIEVKAWQRIHASSEIHCRQKINTNYLFLVFRMFFGTIARCMNPTSMNKIKMKLLELWRVLLS